jgi:hypothetical protein
LCWIVDAVPTPAPLPPPPPTVVVNIPPESTVDLPPGTVDKLGPPPHGLCDWIYTNIAIIATGLLTGLVAIGAAWWAYKGIVKQIGANQDDVRDQIAAENLRRKHEMRVTLVSEVSDVAYDVNVVGARTGRQSPDVVEQMETLVRKLEVRLRVFEMHPQAWSLMNLWDLVVARDVSKAGSPEIKKAYTDLLVSLKKAIPGLDPEKPV